MIGAALSALHSLWEMVPRWLLAVLVIVAVMDGCATQRDLNRERSLSAGAREALKQEREWNIAAVAEANGKVWAAERDLADFHEAQERKDTDAQATIASLRADLGRRAAAGGLRDRYAAACPAASAGPARATAAADRAGDAAEAGRPLSAQFAGELVTFAAEADAINSAYRSCREDAIALRQELAQLHQSPAANSPGSASARPP